MDGRSFVEQRSKTGVFESSQITIPMVVCDLIALWYLFMGGSIVLRPMASLVWVILAIAGFFAFSIRRIYINSYVTRCFLMLVFIAISIMYSIDQSGSLKYVLSILLYLIVAYQFTRSKNNVLFLLKTMRIFLVFLLFVTFVQKYATDLYLSTFAQLLPQQYHREVLLFIQNNSCNGFFNQTSSNALMLSLGVCVFIFFFKLHKSRNKFLASIDLVFVFAFVYGIILTNRRGSLLIVVIMLAYLLYTSNQRLIIKIIITIAALAFILSGELQNLALLANIFSKFGSTILAGDISDGRHNIWNVSWKLFAERPVFGHGIDSMASGLMEISNAHNSYIQSLIEVGVVGTIIYYLPFIYSFRKTITMYKTERKQTTFRAAIIGFCIFWQIYCFANGLFEAFFSSESSVFLLFIVQIVCADMWISYSGESSYIERHGVSKDE